MEWPADPPRLPRRAALKTLAAAAGAGLLPACGSSTAPASRPGVPGGDEALFRHGVASGDPLPDRVILWTRLSGLTETVSGEVAVFEDPQASRLVGVRGFATGPERDHTIKIDFDGLRPQTSYYFQFRALGIESPLGRTRTAAVDARHLRFAVCSCAKYHQALWNSYARIAQMADLDAVIHLGDYLYEEDEKGSAIPGRELVPNIEIYSLGEYRERHALFKTDPDLQEMHRQHPLIAIWDDHEIADNCWYEGAHRHFEDQHGPWAERRAAAVQAYDEWMPIRTQPVPAGRRPFERIYRHLPYGDLLDLLMIDARLIGRDRETPGFASDEPQAPDPLAINDPARSLLGAPQRDWLFERLQASTARWKVIGNPMMFGQLHALPGLKAAGGGIPLNTDQWDGYRADQNRVLEFLRAQAIPNVVVITGDIHSAWAIDLSDDPHNPAVYLPALEDQLSPERLRSLAVEFVTPGVGSSAGSTLGDLIPVAVATNPHIRYAQGGEERGFMILDLTPEQAQADWYFTTVVDRADPDSLQAVAHWYTADGANQVRPRSAPSAPKPRPPPLSP